MARLLRWTSLTVLTLSIVVCTALAYSFLNTRPLVLIGYMESPESPALIQWAAERAFFTFHPTVDEVERLNEEAGTRYAAMFPDRQKAEAMLEHMVANGVDIDSVDQASGLTALQSAALEGHLQAVRLLLAQGADPTAVGSRDGQRIQSKTPLEIARDVQERYPARRFPEIIDLLKRAQE